MIFKALIVAAYMLPMGISNPISNQVKSVEPVIEVPVMAEKLSISQPILTELIEVHATELFTLTIEEAWQAYDSSDLVITELSPNKLYKLVYDGILEIVVVDSAG